MSKKKNTYKKARAITESTLKRLFALSGNECAFDHNGFNCENQIVKNDTSDLMVQICHIEAAEKGGQRYNKNSNDDYRRSFDNLILLCPNHHIKTNDEQIYTSKVLRNMKRNHEAKMLQKLSQQNLISKHPSVLGRVISLIGSQLFDNNLSEEPINAPAPEEKIKYNNVLIYKPIIEAYKIYQGKLNKVYQEIENQGSTKKEFVLKNINTLYLREKGKYTSFDQIKGNADVIFRSIENELWNRVKNLENEMPLEALEMSILVVMVDAFMRCEILEEPPKK